jgi:hypothetical protein
LVFSTDGGVKENNAGFGMVGGFDGYIDIQCYQRPHDIYNNYSSHWSEAWGILGTFYLLKLIIKYRNIQKNSTKMSILILCDNKALINTLKKLTYHTLSIKAFKSADFDHTYLNFEANHLATIALEQKNLLLVILLSNTHYF